MKKCSLGYLCNASGLLTRLSFKSLGVLLDMTHSGLDYNTGDCLNYCNH